MRYELEADFGRTFGAMGEIGPGMFSGLVVARELDFLIDKVCNGEPIAFSGKYALIRFERAVTSATAERWFRRHHRPPADFVDLVTFYVSRNTLEPENCIVALGTTFLLGEHVVAPCLYINERCEAGLFTIPIAFRENDVGQRMGVLTGNRYPERREGTFTMLNLKAMQPVVTLPPECIFLVRAPN